MDALTVMATLDLLIGERVIMGDSEKLEVILILVSNDKCPLDH